MTNLVDTVTINELRDARIFYVPAYQRGYRWNKKQVEELLSDLYIFMKKNSQGQFYCLQPIIVMKREIGQDKPVYEVIDGQQRLTTLFILIKYLVDRLNLDEEEKRDELARLFQLKFETRKTMGSYLNSIEQQSEASNIDEQHALDAYRWIDEWITDKASKDDSVRKRDIISDFDVLLRQNKNTNESCGSVRVIWYEIAQDKSVIREFLSTNNGKIRLTDAELIKALFLQKRNFVQDNEQRKQLEKALDWERIENSLHQDDFWFFISNDKQVPSNRIEKILQLASEGSGQQNLFLHYYQQFEGKEGKMLEDAVNEQWKKVLHCFRCIEDWYIDPIKYNYIGFLSHSGVALSSIFAKYLELCESDGGQELFLAELKSLIRASMSGIKRDGDFLNVEYKHNSQIRKVLLLLNIHTLNSQLTMMNSEKDRNDRFQSPSYKFPFDVFINQEWDVEHIDSRSVNALKSNDLKQAWVEAYSYDFQEDAKFKDALKKQEWAVCIEIIQAKYGESDEYKDTIGNLTLLDDKTNRSYGNAIFPDKRKRIISEIRNGKYVPHCTQMVFFKSFDDDNSTKPVWDEDCKRAYGHYVCDTLAEYLD